EARVTFNKDGKLWTYQARYVKLISNNKSNIEVAELDIIGPPGVRVMLCFIHGKSLLNKKV
ncbi:hypothetical protein ACTPD5_22235, partial [Clostridioides difficile]|uniref:hypothetical protein n=1 Tax=Clostridioides difficile TaxID=1496 RepID=UPI003F8D1108